MSNYSSRLQQAFTSPDFLKQIFQNLQIASSCQHLFSTALLHTFFTVKKFLNQRLSLSLQEQKFLDSLIQKLILMLLTCHMLRSQVIVASQSDSALKTDLRGSSRFNPCSKWLLNVCPEWESSLFCTEQPVMWWDRVCFSPCFAGGVF